jgi:5-methylcytosine-specific restriction endonuclease McrA
MGHRNSTWCWSWSMSPATRCAILLRDKLRCVWCRKKLDPKATHESGLKPQLDHFVPRAQGGKHDTTNLVTSCGECNQEGDGARTSRGLARAEAALEDAPF